MRYLSVCSGIEAATVAWHDLGWTPVAFSEIEPFPSAVLAHHYPHVPNVGDMTKFKEWNLEPINLLVGGTPCQSFSVAGLRKGLDDPRGNLMLTFLAIAERERPKWIVWENVPGVLSSNGGRDFGTFLGALGELGYGWAYRVLDAQWFGVAQRRRRVFVVGCLGDQASAAAVLFESESVQRNPSPSREARQGAARGVTRCFAGSSESGVAATLETTSHDYSRADGFNMVAQPVAGSHWDHPSNPHPTLNQSAKGSGGIAASDQELFSQRGSGLVPQPVAQPVAQPITFGAQMSVPQTDIDMAQTLQAKNPMAVAHALTARMYSKSSPDPGAGRGGPVVVTQPVAFTRCDNGQDAAVDVTPTMRCGSNYSAHLAVAQPVAFKVRGGVEVDSAGKAAGKGYLGSEETAFTIAATQDQWIGQPVGTDCYNGAITGEVAATIGTPGSSVNASGPTVMQAMAYGISNQPTPKFGEDVCPSLDAKASGGGRMEAVASAMQVRRLTPVECERLQGFPDNYTNIPWRKKDEAPDGPRYKALGNSMAVPCMKWIGERIQAATERQEASK